MNHKSGEEFSERGLSLWECCSRVQIHDRIFVSFIAGVALCLIVQASIHEYRTEVAREKLSETIKRTGLKT